jgi:hypothetical protein
MTDDMTLEQLAQRAATVTTRRRTLYQYARSKGFNARESSVLSGRTAEQIDKLAAERAKKGDK